MKNKKLVLILVGILLILILSLIFVILNYTKNSDIDDNKQNLEQNVNVEENNDKIVEEVYYTVNFDSDGGSNTDSVVVLKGECVEKPDNPIKNGYTFIEWQLDGKTFDFTAKIDKEITLKAKWEKNIVVEEKDDEVGSNTNVDTTKKPENVLNLNDNIKVHIEQNTVLCGFAMFTTNLKEVYPHAYIKSGNYVSYWPGEDAVDGEVSEEDLKNKWDYLKFNKSKEQTAEKLLSQYKKSKIEGIKDFTYSINNHRFEYSYNYLTFANVGYKTEAISVNEKIKNAFSSAIKFTGPCGDPIPQAIDLTEELCDEYNLKCDRW